MSNAARAIGSGITVDDSQPGILTVKFLAATDSAVDAMMEVVGERLRREERFGLIIDMGDVATTSTQRKRLAEWQSGDIETWRRWCVACATVTKSRLQRGLVTAYTWLVATPYPLAAFENAEDARAWLLEQAAGPQ